jgi:hypothetical protein
METSQPFLTNPIKFCAFPTGLIGKGSPGRRAPGRSGQELGVRIMPAASVSFEASSTRMKLPVERLRR